MVAYDESQGYALVSGGQPENAGENGCTTGTGTNNSGLWIFTRSQQRDETLINNVRNIATAAGFDVSVLNDVDQSSSNCDQDEFGEPAQQNTGDVSSFLDMSMNLRGGE